MMWYRGTPASLEQAKGMQIPMTNYSFGGGGITLGLMKYSSILRSLRFSPWSIYISLSRTRYWAQSSSVTSMPSFIIGMKFRSKTGNVGPRISWEKARPAFIDPTKVEFLALDFPASCSSFSLGCSSLGLLPLSSLEGAMVLSKLRSTPDRNSSKRKHDEKMIYRPRGLREVI
jgi:hypothetical protein